MKRAPKAFVLPAVLSVTTLVTAPACETGPNDDDAGVTTNATTNSTNASGDTGGEGCFDYDSLGACETDALCNWDPDLDTCVPDCPAYETQDACMDAQVCAWDSIEGCLGPFT